MTRNDQYVSRGSFLSDQATERSTSSVAQRRDRKLSPLLARAIVFVGLLLGGLGVLTVVAFSDVYWVYPVSIYGIFVVWAKREFF